MSAIKRLVLGLVLLAGVLAAVAYVLPGEVSVARATVIEAPEADVFAFLNDPERIVRWSPWVPRDADTTYKLTGPDMGEGARMEWTSPRAGSGTGEIVESRRDTSVRLALDVAPLGRASTHYQLGPAGAGTRVTSRLDTELGNNPIQRWRGLLRLRRLATELDTGLARLKQTVEAAR